MPTERHGDTLSSSTPQAIGDTSIAVTAADPDGENEVWHIGLNDPAELPTPILRTYENGYEKIRDVIPRYKEVEIALPAPYGFAFPLVLQIDDPAAARVLAAILTEAAEQLDQTYTDEELRGTDWETDEPDRYEDGVPVMVPGTYYDPEYDGIPG